MRDVIHANITKHHLPLYIIGAIIIINLVSGHDLLRDPKRCVCVSHSLFIPFAILAEGGRGRPSAGVKIFAHGKC